MANELFIPATPWPFRREIHSRVLGITLPTLADLGRSDSTPRSKACSQDGSPGREWLLGGVLDPRRLLPGLQALPGDRRGLKWPSYVSRGPPRDGGGRHGELEGNPDVEPSSIV
jgi:hypothetical protein